MNERDQQNPQKWIDAEMDNPELRDRYQAAVQSHLDDYLARTRKARYVLVGLAGLVGALVCGSLAMTEPDSLPRGVRLLLYLFASFGLAWTAFAGWVLTRGQGEFQAQRAVAARMAVGFTLASVFALAGVSSMSGRPVAGLPLMLVGMAMLIFAAVRYIGGEIDRSESITREHLLRIESRLVALADRLTHASQRP
jgi:hypothetical protein